MHSHAASAHHAGASEGWAICPADDFDIGQASNGALFWRGMVSPLSPQHLSSTSNDVCPSGQIGSKIAYIESGFQSVLTEKK
ncbi:hypothetical protein [Collimonas sp. PA-H2]|uniref:hypothetical protein n=1 Tax=Collimonas sp. PA-H2 TaxID=1881062 RepID=UPI001180D925|nr:hypothetical protein [Collimonas sp. PA-H2]